MWGCLSPFFYLFVIFSCPARALFVLGVVGKGSPSSPGKKKQKNLVFAIFKKIHTQASIIVALFYALYLGLVTSKQFDKGTFRCIICLLVAFSGRQFLGRASFLGRSLLKQYYRTV